MRATILLLLLCVLSLPAPGQECGTIDTTRTEITIGDAPTPGVYTNQPCHGPGSPGTLLRADPPVTIPEFAAEYADMSFGWGDGHPSTLTTQTIPGGTYKLTDYQVPAGVTLTYSGPVEIRATDVRINGTVRTTSPDASITFVVTQRFEMEGVDIHHATIETTGTGSPIRIGAQWGVTGRFPSLIRAEQSDILISSGIDESVPTVDLNNTEVRGPNGTITISTVNDLLLTEGWYQANGIVLRAREGSVLITDPVMLAGAGGFDMRGASIVISGRSDLSTPTGPILLTAHGGDVAIRGAYSIYSGSGSHRYRASAYVQIRDGSIVGTNSGDIRFEGITGTNVLGDGTTVTSADGDIVLASRGYATIVDACLVHTNRGSIRIDARWTVTLRGSARIGRATGPAGPIEIRCRRLDAMDWNSQAHLQGDSIGLWVDHQGAHLGDGLLRAETGDLRILSTGPITGRGRFRAGGDIRIDGDEDIALDGATLRTDEKLSGTSGSIRISSWAGSEGVLLLKDADLQTGDAPVGSGDIVLRVGEGSAAEDEPTTAWVLPKRVAVSIDDRDPTRSRVSVSGWCDLGPGLADLTAAATLEVGGLDVDVPGMVAKGKKFSHKAGSLKVTFTPSKRGSSLAKFKMAFTGDVTGLVDTEADLTLRFAGAGMDGTGTVRLTKGKYALGKVRGTLVEPGLYLAKAKAAVKGAGKDKLSLTLGLTTDGTTPVAASDFTLDFGEGVSVAIPAASFTRTGDRYEFRGDADGISKVVIDYARETITIKGKGMDLGTIPEGAVEMDVGVGLGDETRAVRVRMVRSGSGLRY